MGGSGLGLVGAVEFGYELFEAVFVYSDVLLWYLRLWLIALGLVLLDQDGILVK